MKLKISILAAARGKKENRSSAALALVVGLVFAFSSAAALEGEPIPGVDVKLGKNPGGSIVAGAPTGPNGTYAFTGLAPGKYDVIVKGQFVRTITVGPEGSITGEVSRGKRDGTAKININNGSFSNDVLIDDVYLEQAEKQGPPPAEFEAGARETLQKLAGAYGAKRRSAFMNLVSEDFVGETDILEDALLKDFRNYRVVNLDLIPDKVEVQGPLASIEFHYNLTVISGQGVNKKFSGRSNYVFRQEDGKAKLYKMQRPIIFGNSIPLDENPIASGQHSPLETESTAPGAQGTARGSALIVQGDPSVADSGFDFDTQSNVAESAADIRKSGFADITANAGGGIVSLGPCNLDTVTSVSPTISGNSATATPGDCYVIRTAENKYAVLRVTATASVLSPFTIIFDYKFQPSGSSSF